MQEIWNESGLVAASRSRELSAKDLQSILQQGSVSFVVADVGKALRWVPEAACFDFWKSEVQSRLAPPNGPVNLDSFPGGYSYFVSEWSSKKTAPIILLEMVH
jgi:hypothetical protein